MRPTITPTTAATKVHFVYQWTVNREPFGFLFLFSKPANCELTLRFLKTPVADDIGDRFAPVLLELCAPLRFSFGVGRHVVPHRGRFCECGNDTTLSVGGLMMRSFSLATRCTVLSIMDPYFSGFVIDRLVRARISEGAH
jgi:hypothetical protein